MGAAIGFVGADGRGRTVSPVDPLPVMFEGLEIPTHDYIGLTYTGDDLTGVVYKTGGAGGTTVASLTLAYSGGKLVSVTRS